MSGDQDARDRIEDRLSAIQADVRGLAREQAAQAHRLSSVDLDLVGIRADLTRLQVSVDAILERLNVAGGAS